MTTPNPETATAEELWAELAARDMMRSICPLLGLTGAEWRLANGGDIAGAALSAIKEERHSECQACHGKGYVPADLHLETLTDAMEKAGYCWDAHSIGLMHSWIFYQGLLSSTDGWVSDPDNMLAALNAAVKAVINEK